MTRYPLLLSRLLKVTPASHGDRDALQESRELIEQGLDSMNQETTRDSGTTKLWRRISMINPPGYRRSEHPIDLLGSTTWGVRKMVLESLGWGKEAREEINFVLENRLMYTQPTETNWRNLFAVKMNPTHALLVTLGQNSVVAPPQNTSGLQFPRETGCREAALILLKEKGMRYSPAREPLMLDKCVICWEHEWDDCFEVTEFSTKESYIFKVSHIYPVTLLVRKTVTVLFGNPLLNVPVYGQLRISALTDEGCFCRGRIIRRPCSGSTSSSSTAPVWEAGGGGGTGWPTS